ncbi:hypothetical protein Mgra_00004086 [Meloidogyne graminicola]|uniref:NADH dehydrogenase [ubiquinone] flavoprotein 3, mitochondrial n=1 Tax=Meloidogyne graminicola TaxID=189291 RepID=A0A8S9ZTI7_9BILA|nr:hypothetical protein Mgra_00004086 [Meloidogyne graminicola]
MVLVFSVQATLVNLYCNLRQLLTMDVRFVNSGELPGAGTSTGIEHAIKFKKIGENNKQSFNDYKCIEYLNFNKDSYYNIECELQKFRAPQPSNKKPDTEPGFKTSK